MEDENYEFLYEDGDEHKHDKLIEKVLTLNKSQQLKKPSRTEPTLEVSEFSLVKPTTGAGGAITIKDLTKALKNKKSRVKISEKIGQLQKKSQTLPKPLEAPQANRIRRTIAYEKTKLDLDRWEPVITSNRVSTTLSFPLNNDVKLDKEETKNFPAQWTVKSKIDEALEKIRAVPEVEEYTIDLEKEKFPLTMKEMMSKRKESAKLRAFQSYKEAKARRQNKIKSKKYHKIEKRERIKSQLKQFEELQKTNPELALKKLDEIEKIRAEERFNLRHKSTGKWAKNQQIKAKYDRQSRQELAEQLAISRDLTQKSKAAHSESEDEEIGNLDAQSVAVDPTNPWINGITPNKEVKEFMDSYKKYWTQKNETKKEDSTEENTQTQKSESVKDVPKIDNESSDDEKVEIKEETPVKNLEKKSKSLKRKAKISDAVAKDEELEMKKGHQVKKLRSKKKSLTSAEKIYKQPKNSKNGKKLREKVEETNDDVDGEECVSEEIAANSGWDVKIISNQSDIDDIFDRATKKMRREALQKVRKIKKKLRKPIEREQVEKETKPKKIDLSLPLQVKKPTLDEELIERVGDTAEAIEELDSLNVTLAKSAKTPSVNLNKESVKPAKVIKTNLMTAIPDLITGEEDEENTQRDLIVEAFEDDDIVDDFNKAKKKEVNASKPKDINLALPGWGSWGGHNIKVSQRKRRRFTIKAPKIARKDDNKKRLIINEKAQTKIKEHMVSEVPFPFKTVKDFEASIRAPIGTTFVTETAHRRLTQPSITTKLGAIIEPMSKDILLNKESDY